MRMSFNKYGTLNVPWQCWLDLLNTDEDGFFFFEAALARQWCSDSCLTGVKVDQLSLADFVFKFRKSVIN